MTGVDDRGLLGHLHAGVAAQLVVPDEPSPDWYAFRHPLTVEALLTQLTPDRRAELARRAADAASELHPELARPVVPAGRRAALPGGRPGRGGTPVRGGGAAGAGRRRDRFRRHPARPGRTAAVGHPGHPAPGRGPGVPAARARRGGRLRPRLRPGRPAARPGRGYLSAPRLAALHTRLAKVAHTAGRWADGNRQIAQARAVLGPAPDEAAAASVDVAAAYLALDTPGTDRTHQAEKLARSAVEAAQRHGLPTVACQGWELLATVARERDPTESQAMLERALTTAERHGLPLRRMYALTRIGGNAWLSDGDTA
ncbi:hypothetical protein LUW77_30680 [Streptomyces radiopugnans]|nr:hypothetical protein LUW77_30680 [Streptomyces radiopugnans]